MPDRYTFCTYFDRNYLPRGLALYHSLTQHCQRPFTLWILCFDAETYAILGQLNLPGVRLISQQAFEAGDAQLAQAKEHRSLVEYYWTCTPSLPLYVLCGDPTIDVITYLDADLLFFSDPGPIYEELGDNSILIIEHRYAPEYAHYAATSGIYNVGLMAFRHDERGLACLQWWRERCLEWCYARFEDNKFGDQKYLDDWPARFTGVTVLQHPGAGLAPWNLTQYRISATSTPMTVNAVALIFYHYHGFKYIRPWVCRPAGAGYAMPLPQSPVLYRIYVSALHHAIGEIHSISPAFELSRERLSFKEIIKGLLEERFLWLRVGPAYVLQWRVNSYKRQQQRLARGFTSYTQGDIIGARRAFIEAAWHNPLVLRNLGIISMLLESWVGTAWMNKYRQWRHKGSPNALPNSE